MSKTYRVTVKSDAPIMAELNEAVVEPISATEETETFDATIETNFNRFEQQLNADDYVISYELISEDED